MGTMNPLSVRITRGDDIEVEHIAAIAVADSQGNLVESAGDPDLFAYFRSSAKPFQAVPLIESGAADAFGLSESDLAFCCSSHNGEVSQQQAVARMLESIGASSELLQCGVAPTMDQVALARVTLGLDAPSPLQNCCSGKHAGMLATCLHLGYPVDSYLSPEHPPASAHPRDRRGCDAFGPGVSSSGHGWLQRSDVWDGLDEFRGSLRIACGTGEVAVSEYASARSGGCPPSCRDGRVSREHCRERRARH